MAGKPWDIQLLDEVGAFLSGLPTKHAAKVEWTIDLLEELGPELPYPHQSNIEGSGGFRELRTICAGQQYRVIYRRKLDTFYLLDGFHKTDEKELGRAVKRAKKLWEQIE